MCGRYTLTAPPEEVAEYFSVPLPDLQPRYNVAPSQVVAVVGLKPDGKSRGLAMLRWSLVPDRTTDLKKAPKPINAQAETVDTKPTFRDSFRSKRCLIPTDGFFEWRKAGKHKAPHHIRLKGGGLFAFAELWAVWGGGPHKLLTCWPSL